MMTVPVEPRTACAQWGLENVPNRVDAAGTVAADGPKNGPLGTGDHMQRMTGDRQLGVVLDTDALRRITIEMDREREVRRLEEDREWCRKPVVFRCGARKRNGEPCGVPCDLGADGLPIRTRCKFHGGASTGPRTAEGRARIAASNRRRAMLKKGDSR